MSASFFKRLVSSVIDVIIVIVFIYITFALIGKPLLQKRIDNFDEVYTSYGAILSTYNEDLTEVQKEYKANMEVANGDADKEAAAQDLYQAKIDILNQQNNIDIEPFNHTLTLYYLNIIYYFVIGFAVIMTAYTLAFKGKTLGRKLMQIQLEGNVNRMTVFVHDIVLKYLILLILFAYSLYYAFILLLILFMLDLVLISFTKSNTTLRDILLKIKVTKANYSH